MTPATRITIGVLLTGLAGIGGFLVQRHLAGREAPAVPPAAEALPEAPFPGAPEQPPVAARKIPERMPDIALPDTQGRQRRLLEWQGRPLIVNFWATWCAPCRREIPLLMKLRREHAGDGLEVLGIAVDFGDAVRQYAAEVGIDYPILVGEEGGLEAAQAFGMDLLLPFTAFVDPEGRIVAVRVGELHAGEAEFILARMKDVSAGRLTLEAARGQIAAELRQQAVERARQGTQPS